MQLTAEDYGYFNGLISFCNSYPELLESGIENPELFSELMVILEDRPTFPPVLSDANATVAHSKVDLSSFGRGRSSW